MAQLNDDDRAELVAYLDGELDEESVLALEARLSRDRQLRAEADALKKTWELLDFLPRAEPTTGFTHRTLERISVRDTGLAPAATRRWPWAAPAAWVAAMLIAILGGGVAGFWLSRPPNPVPPGLQEPDVESQIVNDLEVIRHKRLYDNVDDLDFLRTLSRTINDEGGES